jgi:hypothetical protein
MEAAVVANLVVNFRVITRNMLVTNEENFLVVSPVNMKLIQMANIRTVSLAHSDIQYRW